MTDFDAAGILLDQQGAVLTVTLNRPDVRNAQTPAMWRGLAEVGAKMDPSVRVVVVKGAGEDFSAGLDRRMFTPDGIDGEQTFAATSAQNDAGFDRTIAIYQSGFSWLRDPQFVSIAAVHGNAIGAGFQLALACDLRIAADDASFNMKETALGLVPDLGGTKPLIDAIGYQRALEICATSRVVDGPEAQRIGLVLSCVPRSELAAAVAAMVAALLVPHHGAVEALKGLLQGAAEQTYDGQRARERAAQRGRFRAMLQVLGGN